MKKLIFAILILIILATAAPTVYPPQVYDSSAEPTATPTVAPTPTATPENPLGEWTYVGAARNFGGNTQIYGLMPSGCYEVSGTKTGKTITVLSDYIGDADCRALIVKWNEHGNLGRVIPFPLATCTGDESVDVTIFPCFCPTYAKSQTSFFCGDIYSTVFPANSQRVCSGDMPWNCVEVR